MGLIARRRARKAERARHNDFDSRCAHWFGDRSPGRDRKGPWVWSGWKAVPVRLTNMDDSPTMAAENRCGVCNPYTEAEEHALLTGEAPAGTWWLGSVLVAASATHAEDHR